VEIKSGQLKLQTLRLAFANAPKTVGANAKLAGNGVSVGCAIDGDHAMLTFNPGIVIAQGQTLSVELA
jgi:hypothetical protein